MAFADELPSFSILLILVIFGFLSSIKKKKNMKTHVKKQDKQDKQMNNNYWSVLMVKFP